MAYLTPETEALKRAINSTPEAFLEKARDGTFICPDCGSGSGHGSHKHGADGRTTQAHYTGMTYQGQTDDPSHLHFTCWAGKCYENADMIQILSKENGCSFWTALKIGAERLGLPVPEQVERAASYTENRGTNTMNHSNGSQPEGPRGSELPKERIYQKPLIDYTPLMEQAERNMNQTDYMTRVRGIMPEALKKYHVGYDPQFVPVNFLDDNMNFVPNDKWRYKGNNPKIVIPITPYSFFTRDTRPTDQIPEKARNSTKMNQGRSAFWNFRDAERPGPVFVVEGAIDAMTITQQGYRAVALDSTSNVDAFVRLIQETGVTPDIIICLDHDGPGTKAQSLLAQKLTEIGIHSTQPDIIAGYKDPNEAYMADHAGFTTRLNAAVNEMTQSLQGRLPGQDQTWTNNMVPLMRGLGEIPTQVLGPNASTLEAQSVRGLAMYKRMCEAQTEFLKTQGLTEEQIQNLTADDPQLVANVRANLGYFIPAEHMWSTWMQHEPEFTASSWDRAMQNLDNTLVRTFGNVTMQNAAFGPLTTYSRMLAATEAEKTEFIRTITYALEGIPQEHMRDVMRAEQALVRPAQSLSMYLNGDVHQIEYQRRTTLVPGQEQNAPDTRQKTVSQTQQSRPVQTRQTPIAQAQPDAQAPQAQQAQAPDERQQNAPEETRQAAPTAREKEAQDVEAEAHEDDHEQQNEPVSQGVRDEKREIEAEQSELEQDLQALDSSNIENAAGETNEAELAEQAAVQAAQEAQSVREAQEQVADTAALAAIAITAAATSEQAQQIAEELSAVPPTLQDPGIGQRYMFYEIAPENFNFLPGLKGRLNEMGIAAFEYEADDAEHRITKKAAKQADAVKAIKEKPKSRRLLMLPADARKFENWLVNEVPPSVSCRFIEAVNDIDYLSASRESFVRDSHSQEMADFDQQMGYGDLTATQAKAREGVTPEMKRRVKFAGRFPKKAPYLVRVTGRDGETAEHIFDTQADARIYAAKAIDPANTTAQTENALLEIYSIDIENNPDKLAFAHDYTAQPQKRARANSVSHVRITGNYPDHGNYTVVAQSRDYAKAAITQTYPTLTEAKAAAEAYYSGKANKTFSWVEIQNDKGRVVYTDSLEPDDHRPVDPLSKAEELAQSIPVPAGLKENAPYHVGTMALGGGQPQIEAFASLTDARARANELSGTDAKVSYVEIYSQDGRAIYSKSFEEEDRRPLDPPELDAKETPEQRTEPIAQTVQAPEPIAQTVQAPEPIAQTVQAPEPIAQTVQAPEPIAQTVQQTQPISTAHEQKTQVNEPPTPIQSELPQAGEPTVTISFSENPLLATGITMPLSQANELFKELDTAHSGSGYEKIDFAINYMKDGEAQVYEGRYDIGSGDGTLVDHIKSAAQQYTQDTGQFDTYAAIFGHEEAQVLADGWADVRDNFVPYLEDHLAITEIQKANPDVAIVQGYHNLVNDGVDFRQVELQRTNTQVEQAEPQAQDHKPVQEAPEVVSTRPIEQTEPETGGYELEEEPDIEAEYREETDYRASYDNYGLEDEYANDDSWTHGDENEYGDGMHETSLEDDADAWLRENDPEWAANNEARAMEGVDGPVPENAEPPVTAEFVITDKEPIVTFGFCAQQIFEYGEQMPLSEANAKIGELDQQIYADTDNPHMCSIQYRINAEINGEQTTYQTTQHAGNGEGSILDHVKAQIAFYQTDPNWRDFHQRVFGEERTLLRRADWNKKADEFIPTIEKFANQEVSYRADVIRTPEDLEAMREAIAAKHEEIQSDQPPQEVAASIKVIKPIDSATVYARTIAETPPLPDEPMTELRYQSEIHNGAVKTANAQNLTTFLNYHVTNSALGMHAALAAFSQDPTAQIVRSAQGWEARGYKVASDAHPIEMQIPTWNKESHKLTRNVEMGVAYSMEDVIPTKDAMPLDQPNNDYTLQEVLRAAGGKPHLMQPDEIVQKAPAILYAKVCKTADIPMQNPTAEQRMQAQIATYIAGQKLGIDMSQPSAAPYTNMLTDQKSISSVAATFGEWTNTLKHGAKAAKTTVFKISKTIDRTRDDERPANHVQRHTVRQAEPQKPNQNRVMVGKER